MSRVLSFASLLVFSSTYSPLDAEIPLPDAIFFGTITRDGELVSSGELVGVVTRNGTVLLEVPGEFTSPQGVPHYVLRIPMETSGVTPLGSDRNAAREGDVLERLLLDGDVIATPDTSLAAAGVSRVDVGGTVDGGPLFVRGDCNGDGEPDISDAIKTLLYLFGTGGSPDCEKACDANDDGGVDLADAVLVLDFLLIGGSPPLAPFPGCGLDPSSDDLLCALGASGCAVDGGGGAVVAKARGGRQGKESKDHRASVAAATPDIRTTARTTAPRGDGPAVAHGGRVRDAATDSGADTGAWRLDSPLEVSPRRIRMGALASEGNVKTMTFRNRSDRAMRLSVAPTSEAFSVAPSTLDLPPDGTFVVFVERPRFASVTDDGASDAARAVLLPEVEVFESDVRVGTVPIEASAPAGEALVRLGNVAVAKGTSRAIRLPVVVSGTAEPLVVAITYDGVFAVARFEPAPGVAWSELDDWIEPRDTTSLALELRPERSFEDDTAGMLVLLPREPLRPGTYPVWVRAVETSDHPNEIAIGTVHGEVCARVPWLDVDGDGAASLKPDLVLVERFVEGSVPLIPPDWPPGDLSTDSIHARIGERAGYFDVDASGGLDGEDLALIDRALRGLPISGADVNARVRNLYVPSEAERDAECANAQGTFSIADVQRLLEHLFHERALACPLRFDVDRDGELTTRDAVLMVRFRTRAEGGDR